MKHEMKLNNYSFDKIKNGTKTVELRLNDEKRQKLNINENIEFTNIKTLEKIIVTIKALHKYKNFDKISMGYKENEITNHKEIEQYYSKEEQSKYGVVGIEIEIL